MKGTKKIINYPKYSITKNGTVLSNAQNSTKELKPRVVTQSKKGYLQVSLYNEKCKRNSKGAKLPDQVYIHRLVWETFNGPIPEGKEIDHIDNDTRNNHIDNLQLVTRRNNMLKYNRTKFGKLSVDMLDEINDLQSKGYSIKDIANKLGKSYPAIWRIVKKKKQMYKMVNGKREYYLIDFDYDKVV